MKKFKQIKFLSLLILVITFVSCDEDEFLREVNPNAVTEDTFWQTQEQFNAALTTVYGALQFQSVSGGLLQHQMVRGDIAGTEPWYRPLQFRNLTFNDGTFYVTDKWSELYIGVFRANQVINQIQTADATVVFNDNNKAQIEAQARFLRAFFYFQIAHTYGQGIIHTTVPAAGEFNKDLSTIQEITETVIKPDLEFAKSNLPESWTENDLGRVTWGAATSLLGKVYLYEEDWSMAAQNFKEVIDSGVYSLTTNIMDNFRHDTEFNSESIFEVAYNDELAQGVGGGAVDDFPGGVGAEASTLSSATGQLSFNAFNTLLASYYLHEMLLNDVIDPTNSINTDGNTHSKRLTATIAPINGEGEYYNLPFGDRPGWGFGQSAYVKKHSNWYHKDQEDAVEFSGRSGINFRHIRLADVYLMYAEAVLEESGDVTTAIDYIDRVRTRSGVIALDTYITDNGGMFPQLHVSKEVHGTQPMVSPSVENVMTHLRRVERPSELCFEGHRWNDLVRWGIVSDVFSELAADEAWREANKETVLQINSGGVAPLFIIERIRPDFTIANGSYTPSQHDYLPIPTGEVQANGNLITN
ncbi:RagB/SusD family nutrient uptake outer membrane protein [Tenacibaculum sp. M341]|uniref:RagB/SusD family nutrient uptake outer membrane protein n=1 Tax=Tenacibaculum sp. M341 TaxID=2530339 RepID=UPI001046FB77|nr:RagB/SusD family nutrient uptake outer membrane protein [Tenacibaculum sp. M341]TCI94157.1 RagB/SusD family nutrient uptake outer membrane protein [Tenacibaculum sp. M341]